MGPIAEMLLRKMQISEASCSITTHADGRPPTFEMKYTDVPDYLIEAARLEADDENYAAAKRILDFQGRTR